MTKEQQQAVLRLIRKSHLIDVWDKYEKESDWDNPPDSSLVYAFDWGRTVEGGGFWEDLEEEIEEYYLRYGMKSTRWR